MAGGGSWKQTFRTCADAGAQLLPPSLASNGRRSLRGSGIADDAWLRAHRGRAREERRATGTRWLHERLLHAVQAGSLPGLLRVADRGAMMHGVESRLPFLTKELAEFALSLPDHLLVADSGVGKAIFRQAMRGLVPDVVLDRREKLGFAVPLRDWLLGSRYARDLAADGAALPCVNGARVRGWIADLDARRPLRDAPVFLMWRVIGFAHWVRACGVSLPE
jgi:asparagine synthase (glutamine-hydrolysing)